jgi:hypothetical protein
MTSFYSVYVYKFNFFHIVYDMYYFIVDSLHPFDGFNECCC